MTEILDCTIRDGSYVTNYYWEPYLLKTIVSGLAANGLRYIEIGNGTGMGAFRKISGALSDTEYYRNAIPAKGDSHIGSFFIPGIGAEDDLKLFRESGGDFVRIGVNVTETDKAVKSIKQAKILGYFVCCNLMKTYAASKYQLIRNIEPLVDNGADCIYVVDSAGGMIPDQVRDYFRALREFFPKVRLGFHGHNNLLLANANSLMAAQSGASFVDATLGGLGRGAGNAQLESLIAIFKKIGLANSFNITGLSDLCSTMLNSTRHTVKGSSKREISEGATNFHSSFTKLLESAAEEYDVDPEMLMTEVCKINVINPSQALFNKIAKEMAAGSKNIEAFFPKFHHNNF